MKKTNFSSIKRVLKYIKRYTALLILSILLSVCVVCCTLYIPIIVGQAIDQIIGAGAVEFSIITPLLWRVIIISLVIVVLQWIMNTINNKITYNVTRDVRNEAFDKLGTLPLSYIDSHQSGAVVSRMISDVDQLAEGLLMGFTQFFTGIATIIGTLIFMLILSPLITVVVVVLTPLSLVVASFISKRTYALFKVQSEARAEQTSIINENIGNLKVVKAFSHEDESLEDFDKSNGLLKNSHSYLHPSMFPEQTRMQMPNRYWYLPDF